MKRHESTFIFLEIIQNYA